MSMDERERYYCEVEGRAIDPADVIVDSNHVIHVIDSQSTRSTEGHCINQDEVAFLAVRQEGRWVLKGTPVYSGGHLGPIPMGPLAR